MNEKSYNTMMETIAADAAKARVQRLRDIDPRLKTPKFEDAKQNDPNFHYKTILKFLKEKYPFGEVTDTELGELMDYKAEGIAKWIYEKGPSPTEAKEREEANAFIPLLNGVAEEGEDWRTMGSDRLKSIATDMGWKVNTKEGFQKFLDKVGEYQQAFDRGKIATELRDMPGYTLSSLFYPSAVQEIENAVMTGEGGDQETVTNLAALDALTNMGIFAAPSLGGARILSKAPRAKLFLDPFISGVSQAGAEAVRQEGKEKLSKTGQEADFEPVMTAGTFGATVPAAVGGFQGFLSQIPGTGRIARGMSMARRSGNPVEMETARVLENIDDFNNSQWLQQLLGNAPEVEVALTPAEAARLNRVQGLNGIFEELFGVPATSKGIDKAAVARNIEKPIKEKKIVGTGVKTAPKNSVNLGESEADEILLDEKTLPIYQRTFPARYENMTDNSKDLQLGRWLGQIGLDVGGRVEPMLKLPLSYQGIKELQNPDYKKSAWYSKMSDNKKKLVDEAFKQKAMEREFEELVKQKPEAVRRAQMDIPDRDLKNPLTEKEYELVMAMRKRGFDKMLGGEQ